VFIIFLLFWNLFCLNCRLIR